MKQTIKTIMHHYRFELSDPGNKEKYIALCNKLRAMNLTVFDSISSDHSRFYSEKIKPLDGSVVELETDHLFNNQWNTAATKTSDKGLRVFDWAEAIYPNRSIKEGMWLEQTDEMEEIRKNTHKCGYCGKNYYKPTHDWCNSCLGSEYLEEQYIPLLQLQPITGKQLPTIPIPESLMNEYAEAQKAARLIRLENRKHDFLTRKEKELQTAQLEYTAFKMLVDAGLDYDNCIYYAHTDTFCFGWRTPLTDDRKNHLRKTLPAIGFNYNYNLE